MFQIPSATVIRISFEGKPEEESATIDILEAYDMASTLKEEHADEWLKAWGKWVGDRIGEELGYSQYRPLWDYIHQTATDILEDRKKKAEMTAF